MRTRHAIAGTTHLGPFEAGPAIFIMFDHLEWSNTTKACLRRWTAHANATDVDLTVMQSFNEAHWNESVQGLV